MNVWNLLHHCWFYVPLWPFDGLWVRGFDDNYTMEIKSESDSFHSNLGVVQKFRFELWMKLTWYYGSGTRGGFPLTQCSHGHTLKMDHKSTNNTVLIIEQRVKFCENNTVMYIKSVVYSHRKCESNCDLLNPGKRYSLYCFAKTCEINWKKQKKHLIINVRNIGNKFSCTHRSTKIEYVRRTCLLESFQAKIILFPISYKNILSRTR